MQNEQDSQASPEYRSPASANFQKVEDSGSLSLSYLTLSDKVWSGCYHFLCLEEETETSVIGGRY